jgi:hypothetical protein
MNRQHPSRRLGVELSSGHALIQFAPQRQPYLGPGNRNSEPEQAEKDLCL